MDIKVFRAPSGQDYQQHHVEKVNDKNPQKKKKEDEQKKKKKNEQMEDIFSSLAESLSRENDDI